MKGAIGTREVLTVVAGGVYLRGTHHVAHPSRLVTAAGADEKNPIGVLFLNPGILPRAATGDTAVGWADSFATSGYPCFRIDLPGFGDSDGDLPKEVLDFQCIVEAGGYGPVLSEVAKTLVERFSLSGLIIFGHCAGAISALFAAARSNNIKGLVLLDPYFYGRQRITNRNVLSRWHMRIVRRIEEATVHPIRSSVEEKLLAYLKKTWHRLKNNDRIVREKGLPKNANLPLIRCWNRVASASLPILVLTSSELTPKPEKFDYIGFLQRPSEHRSHFAVRPVAGTSHSFSEHKGREGVRTYTEQWLSLHFPILRERDEGCLQISFAAPLIKKPPAIGFEA